MQYILLTITDKNGFITGVDWLMNSKEQKEPFILKYKCEVIQQHTFREEEWTIFYNLISSCDLKTVNFLNIFDEERKEKLNKDK